MRAHRRQLAFLVIAMGALTAFATAQERPRVRFTGTVVDASGAVVPGVRVDAKPRCKCSDCPDDCSCCPSQVAATTNEAGNFVVDLVAGPYEVTVSGAGIESKTLEATVGPGQANTVTITVSRKTRQE